VYRYGLCLHLGELIGIEYLYSQTGKVLTMTLPEPDSAIDEDDILEQIPLDEGFEDVAEDADDLTVPGLSDEVELHPTVSTATISTPATAEEPDLSQAAAPLSPHAESAGVSIDETTFIFWPTLN
jgi:hypothetical protein